MNVVGFNDGPFQRDHQGRVLLVGAICSRGRLDGVVSGCVQRDGTDATRRIYELIRRSPFHEHVNALMLQGISVAGFNVVDVHALAAALELPLLVVMRRAPDLPAMRQALFSEAPRGRPRVTGALRKWRLIRAAGDIERLSLQRSSAAKSPVAPEHPLWVQRVGLSVEQARRLLRATTLHGALPEPLRLAHLIAGGVASP